MAWTLLSAPFVTETTGTVHSNVAVNREKRLKKKLQVPIETRKKAVKQAEKTNGIIGYENVAAKKALVITLHHRPIYR